VTAEVSKTKPPSKEKKDAPLTRIGKPGTKAVTITKQTSATSLSQTSYAKAAPLDKSITKATLAPTSAKGKGKMPADPETKKPAHPQRLDAEPPVEKEMIELPEPNSEYSDSEDESRQRKQNAPEWTQSPELRAALESQSRVNPDDIFGPVRPLRMEDIFRTRTSRFRARTSSANWSGPDGLKQEEEREYARRMGFR
jgi:Inner centromere protein, ARK binding region